MSLKVYSLGDKGHVWTEFLIAVRQQDGQQLMNESGETTR